VIPLRPVSVAVALAAVLALVVAACDAGAASGRRKSRRELPQAVLDVMAEEPYQSARWGLRVEELDGDDVPYSRAAGALAASGSTGKLFSVGTWLDVVGTDDRLVTPVHALGTQSGSALAGDLVLVASGDLALGGREADTGTLAYNVPPQTVANGIAGAQPAPGDPLAGLNDLAAQVVASGITAIDGDVVVDDRLWETWDTNDGPISPMVVNDNLLDVVVTPAEPGQPAALRMIPETSAFTVVNEVRTTDSGGESGIELVAGPENTVVASGTIAADAEPLLRVQPVQDPASYGRALFIEALERAGIAVGADPTAPNSIDGLPAFGSYAPDSEVASLTSTTSEAVATLIWKISHNVGANMTVCLLAVHAGSTDCTAGFAPIRERIGRLGIDQGDVWLLDGAGGGVSSVTPAAVNTWLRWLRGASWGDRLPGMLPILGVDGSLGLSETDSPARGKVQAKTGTFGAVDPGTGRLLMPGESLAGFIDADDGTTYVFSVYMINASFPDPASGILQVGDDLASVAAALQQAL
jgi:D-alanyl-D-alanine carboxypeptidase/D-alanyl-D-alanine-endopeptidase (penicillin-binding protein 4)